MITYTKDEIIASTKFSRNLGSILDKLKQRKLNKVAVMRNNELEAVLLPVSEYEKIAEAAKVAEHIALYNTIKEREKTPLDEAIPFEDILDEYGLNEDDL